MVFLIIKDHLYCKFCVEYDHIFPNLKFSVHIPIHHVGSAIKNFSVSTSDNQRSEKPFIPFIPENDQIRYKIL